MILRFLYASILTSCFCLSTYSQPQKKIKLVKVIVTLKEDTRLAKLFSKFIFEDSIVKKSSPMTKKTFSANPGIKNWQKLSKGTKVTLYLNKAFIDPEKIKEYKKSLPKKKKKKAIAKKKIKKIKEQRFYAVHFSYGQVNIENDSNETLTMDFMKVGARYRNKLKNDYSYNVVLSTVQFSNLNYSEGDETLNSNDFLPELELGITKKVSDRFLVGSSYNLLNYYVLGESDTKFTLTPEDVHRINLKPTYLVNDKFTLLSSLGYLSGAGDGFDTSLGIAGKVGKEKLEFNLALALYHSQLKVEDRNETSNAMMIFFGYQL